MEALTQGIARRQLTEALRANAQDRVSPVGDDIEFALGTPALAPELKLTVRNQLRDLGENRVVSENRIGREPR